MEPPAAVSLLGGLRLPEPGPLRCAGNPVPWGDGTPPEGWEDLPAVSDAELRRALAELFRPRAAVPGGTAGAVRVEMRSGTVIRGRSHVRKAQERAGQLRRLLQQGTLDAVDAAIARRVLIDPDRALRGEPRR